MRTTGAPAIHRAASSPPPECTGWPRASGPTGSSASATPGRPTRTWWPDERGRRPDPAYPEAMADESALYTARVDNVGGTSGQVRLPGEPEAVLPTAGPVEGADRSEEHTLNSSHVAISYAVFCLKQNITDDTSFSD